MQPWPRTSCSLSRILADVRQLSVGVFLVLGFAGLAATATARQPNLQRFEYSLPRMGTQFRIVLYTSSQEKASRAAMAAFDRVEELEEILSNYREDSELNRVAREAVAAPRVVSRELFFVLDKSLLVSRLSGGAFDVTVGPVVAIWREARRAKRLPEPTALAQAKAAVGYQNIELDPVARTVRLKRSGMRIDLGGIAKGYGADEALKVLRSHGVQSALVDAGGDIALGAAPPGKPGWKVVVQGPSARGTNSPCALILSAVAVATSGDTYQFAELGGQRLSHIINPEDGMGVKDAASTTVIARDGITADALATTLSVLPVSEGLKLVESLDGVAALMVRRAAGTWHYFSSPGFPRQCAEVSE